LQDAAVLQKTFFEGPPKGRTVRILAAKVFVPEIVVGVELDEANGSVLFGNRAKNGQADGMIAADADAAHSGIEKRSNSLLDAAKRVFDGKRIDAEITEVRDAVLGEGIHLEDGIPGTNDCGLRAHVSRPETRTGAIGGAPIERHAHQCDFQLLGLGDVREAHERGDAGEARVPESVGRLRVRETERAAGLGHGKAS
jgi:hypothetical protein